MYHCERYNDQWYQADCLPLGEVEPSDELLSLNITDSEDYLIGVRLRGFQIYDFKNTYTYLGLPGGECDEDYREKLG